MPIVRTFGAGCAVCTPQCCCRNEAGTFWLMLIKADTSSSVRLSRVAWSAWLKVALETMIPAAVSLLRFDMRISRTKLSWKTLQHLRIESRRQWPSPVPVGKYDCEEPRYSSG